MFAAAALGILICMVLVLMPGKLQFGFAMLMASLDILEQDKPKVHLWIWMYFPTP